MLWVQLRQAGHVAGRVACGAMLREVRVHTFQMSRAWPQLSFGALGAGTGGSASCRTQRVSLRFDIGDRA